MLWLVVIPPINARHSRNVSCSKQSSSPNSNTITNKPTQKACIQCSSNLNFARFTQGATRSNRKQIDGNGCCQWVLTQKANCGCTSKRVAVSSFACNLPANLTWWPLWTETNASHEYMCNIFTKWLRISQLFLQAEKAHLQKTTVQHGAENLPLVASNIHLEQIDRALPAQHVHHFICWLRFTRMTPTPVQKNQNGNISR